MNIVKKQMTRKSSIHPNGWCHTRQSGSKPPNFRNRYRQFFGHVDVWHGYLELSLPTSTTVEARHLSHPDLIVEIEAVAVNDL
jgi:enamine deaminase RidA (YjgF/YER057c/UK114 family)